MRAVISQANENQETGEMKIEMRTDLSSLGQYITPQEYVYILKINSSFGRDLEKYRCV